jgi:hypothetical protein
VQGPVYAFYDMLADWFGVDRVAVAPVYAAFRARVIAHPLPKTLALPPRYVIVAPGCSAFGKERQLRPDEWRSLLANAGFDGVAVVLLGDAADRQLCDAIVAELGHGYSLSGQLGIAQSARVLAGAERFFGIDSLLLHLAHALGVSTTSVWGPSDPVTRLRPGWWRTACTTPKCAVRPAYMSTKPHPAAARAPAFRRHSPGPPRRLAPSQPAWPSAGRSIRAAARFVPLKSRMIIIRLLQRRNFTNGPMRSPGITLFRNFAVSAQDRNVTLRAK